MNRIRQINSPNTSTNDTLVEYVLNPDIAKYFLNNSNPENQKETSRSTTNNDLFFKKDFLSHNLEKYKGTAVLYWNGMICGQSQNSHNLYLKARELYGDNGITVFEVPNSSDELEQALGYSHR